MDQKKEYKTLCPKEQKSRSNTWDTNPPPQTYMSGKAWHVRGVGDICTSAVNCVCWSVHVGRKDPNLKEIVDDIEFEGGLSPHVMVDLGVIEEEEDVHAQRHHQDLHDICHVRCLESG